MDVTKYFNPKKVDEDMNTMNSFGIRLTGTDAQNEFCEWIKAQIIKFGLDVNVTPYTFKRCSGQQNTQAGRCRAVLSASPFP